jgi:hypothetical protein
MDPKVICLKCKNWVTKSNYARHMRRHANVGTLPCLRCSKNGLGKPEPSSRGVHLWFQHYQNEILIDQLLGVIKEICLQDNVLDVSCLSRDELYDCYIASILVLGYHWLFNNADPLHDKVFELLCKKLEK